MFKIVFAIFMFFAELPITLKLNFNFWFWILFFVAPVLTFCVGPERSTILHIARVICAVGLTFSLLNLALGTYQSFQWRDYHACLEDSGHRTDSWEAVDACSHHINQANAQQANIVFGLGWIPAAVYTGLWELLWRIRHRKKIRAMGKNFQARWLSNVTIGFISLPFFLALFIWYFFWLR